MCIFGRNICPHLSLIYSCIEDNKGGTAVPAVKIA